jgi:hypothetical protein
MLSSKLIHRTGILSQEREDRGYHTCHCLKKWLRDFFPKREAVHTKHRALKFSLK